MTQEIVRPGQLAARQRRALAAYIRYEVRPFSSFNRRRLERSGLTDPVEPAALRRMEPVGLGEVDPEGVVLRATAEGVKRAGPSRERLLISAESLLRGADGVRARLDPRFKPVHWYVAGGVLIANTTADLHVLGDLGRMVLARAGVGRDDRVVNLVPAGPNRDYWQIVLGCQSAGVAAIHGPEGVNGDVTAATAATVLVAPPRRAHEVLTAIDPTMPVPSSLHTVLAVGPLTAAGRQRLDEAGAEAGVAVVHAYAPPGVRTLWSERKGVRGLATFPEHELVEVVDAEGRPARRDQAGQLLWTPLGWRGSVVLRLDTGLQAGVRTVGVTPVVDLAGEGVEQDPSSIEPDEGNARESGDGAGGPVRRGGEPRSATQRVPGTRTVPRPTPVRRR